LKGYNDRLFNKKSIRGQLHFARYYWLKNKISKYVPQAKSFLDLGCFDGKAIDFLPSEMDLYHGYDANWEGGLDDAQKKYVNDKKHMFFLCEKLADFNPSQKIYDVTISMETLEHLPLAEIDKYIEKLYHSTSKFCFITIPNEQGIVLIFKHLIKRFILKNLPEQHTIKELFYGFFGKVNRIERIEGGHKGFSFTQMISKLEKVFIVKEVSGIPFSFLPKQVNFSIGIVLIKN
jgi:2-polyprenyl-3-methyl-5-hydroxy-6-metoxy-1,4-benzoquinol methylase